jgi:hypothetical protein
MAALEPLRFRTSSFRNSDGEFTHSYEGANTEKPSEVSDQSA